MLKVDLEMIMNKWEEGCGGGGGGLLAVKLSRCSCDFNIHAIKKASWSKNADGENALVILCFRLW